MKTLRIVAAILLVSQFTANAQDKKTKTKDQTYAELSIKEGGKWVGQKYEGGTFKNVTSLKVPKSHWDHSFFIRYEGPGWESNKIGYRLYLDWRNCIDLFGNSVPIVGVRRRFVGCDGLNEFLTCEVSGRRREFG